MLIDSNVISLQISTAGIMQQIIWIGSSSIWTVRTFVPVHGIPGIRGVRIYRVYARQIRIRTADGSVNTGSTSCNRRTGSDRMHWLDSWLFWVMKHSLINKWLQTTVVPFHEPWPLDPSELYKHVRACPRNLEIYDIPTRAPELIILHGKWNIRIPPSWA